MQVDLPIPFTAKNLFTPATAGKTERVAIIGCGIIGAMIAYELAKTGVSVTVWEAQPEPATGATGAALGLLMGVCSSKAKGDLVNLRLASLARYDSLIRELEALTGAEILYNRAGIVGVYAQGDQSKALSLAAIRQEQGFPLAVWDGAQLQELPGQWRGAYGVYSPADRAVHPGHLVQALVAGAKYYGAKFHWGTPIRDLQAVLDGSLDGSAAQPNQKIVLTAGMGCNELLGNFLARRRGGTADGLAALQTEQTDALGLEELLGKNLLKPVGGHGLRIRLPALDFCLNNSDSSNPAVGQVIHMVMADGTDFNLVPLHHPDFAPNEYWLGATIEFDVDPDLSDFKLSSNSRSPDRWQWLLEQAQEFSPWLAEAEVLSAWTGYRPRPANARSPILGVLPEEPHILLAMGHYRNGLLMAPITAQLIRDLL
jgi:glycine oxidase